MAVRSAGTGPREHAGRENRGTAITFQAKAARTAWWRPTGPASPFRDPERTVAAWGEAEARSTGRDLFRSDLKVPWQDTAALFWVARSTFGRGGGGWDRFRNSVEDVLQ